MIQDKWKLCMHWSRNKMPIIGIRKLLMFIYSITITCKKYVIYKKLGYLLLCLNVTFTTTFHPKMHTKSVTSYMWAMYCFFTTAFHPKVHTKSVTSYMWAMHWFDLFTLIVYFFILFLPLVRLSNTEAPYQPHVPLPESTLLNATLRNHKGQISGETLFTYYVAQQ